MRRAEPEPEPQGMGQELQDWGAGGMMVMLRGRNPRVGFLEKDRGGLRVTLEGWDAEGIPQQPGVGLGRAVPVRLGCSGAPSSVSCSRRKKLLASISSLHPKSAEAQGRGVCSICSLQFAFPLHFSTHFIPFASTCA